LPVFAGWFPDVPKVYIVVGDNEELAAALIHLARIGVDNVEGALIGGFDSWKEAGLPLLQSGTIDALGLQAQLSETLVLDVREDTEFKSGHIEGARHLFVGYVQQHITRLKADLESKPNIVVTCGVGHRAGVAVSVLERQGYKNVTNLLGGMKAWSAANLPLVKDSEHHISTADIEGERA
jgi:hydroxyacylglutathione hydrolase